MNSDLPKKVFCVIGTRPEAIKMAPIILELKRHPSVFDVKVVATAQHRDLLDQVNATFGIVPDFDLDVMSQRQSLVSVVSKVMREMSALLTMERPDIVLAQGDTGTVMATASACFFAQVPFGHVEAGLRTGNLAAPFPEEFNRRVASMAATYHFAPTVEAKLNLLQERVPEHSIFVTGNSVVDAMRFIFEHYPTADSPIPAGASYILMTCHRRESFGEPLRNIFRCVNEFLRLHPEVFVWFPIHPNPVVKQAASEEFSGVSNLFITPPLDYVTLLHALRNCMYVLTDSGGLQEEAATLGKPVLVLRDTTERPEGVRAGIARLVGVDPLKIAPALTEMLSPAVRAKCSSVAAGIYGDGETAKHIFAALAEARPQYFHPS